MRHVRITISAEARCNDDRFMARILSNAIRRMTERPEVADGSWPYCIVIDDDLVLVQNYGIQPVRLRYVVRFRWWHTFVPGWFINWAHNRPLWWLK